MAVCTNEQQLDKRNFTPHFLGKKVQTRRKNIEF